MANAYVGEWIWRFVALVLLVAVGWMGWVIYQINPTPLVLAAAFDAATKARFSDDAQAGLRKEGLIKPAPEPARAEAAPAAPEPAKAEPAPAAPEPAKAEAAPKAPEPAKVETAAAAPEPPKPAPAPAKSMEEEVTEAVQAWAKAWSSQDADAYLASYAPDFKVPGGEPRAAWEKSRRQRIAAPKSIAVTVDDLKIAPEGDARARATFRQGYRSDVLQPMQTTKTLILVRSDGRWRIREERSGN